MYSLRSTALVLSLFGSIAASPIVNAGVSANAGFVTDYYFRGFELGDAGAYAGLDYEAGGFYVGTWLINDGGEDASSSSTIEYDVYAGYGHEFESGFSLSGGFTAYNYEYSSSQQVELNLGVGYKGFSLDYADGEDVDAGFSPTGGLADAEYDYLALGWSGDVFGVTYGISDYDDLDPSTNSGAEGDYEHLEVSASKDFEFGEKVGAISFGVTLGVRDPDDSAASSDVYLFLDVSKSFDF